MSASRPASNRAWTLVALALVAVAVVFRCYALGRLPGINGDEAWYGVQAAHLADGTASWRTPNGNLPGPLHLGVLLALQAVLPPSFTLLRVPSLLASFGAMAMAYAIGRRYFDRRTALALLLLTAALPANIAYARFGWDPSWNVLVDLGATWFALAGNPVGTALVFLLALAVHPTNLFAAPFLLLTLAGTVWQQDGRQAAIDRSVRLTLLMLAAIVLLTVSTSGGHAALAPGLLDRVVDPSNWFTFIILYDRLLSGDTVYTYIAGGKPGAIWTLVDAATLFAFGALLIFGVRSLKRVLRRQDAGITAGWLASLAAFYLIAGTDAIRPQVDRYALCLIVPSLIAIVVLARHLAGRLFLPVACLIAALLLAGFATRYFGVLARTGSATERAFWTGPTEPKQVAFRHILAEAAPRGGARVIAEDYWLRWPFAYLALGTPLTVVQTDEPVGRAGPGGTYLVAFGGSGFDRAIAASGRARLRWTIAGTARPALLRIWWTPPGAPIPRIAPTELTPPPPAPASH